MKCPSSTTILFLANVIFMVCSVAWMTHMTLLQNDTSSLRQQAAASHAAPVLRQAQVVSSKSSALPALKSSGRRVSTVRVDVKDVQEGQRDFLAIAMTTGTDKVLANQLLEKCLTDEKMCVRPGCAREACRPWGHFYNTMYQRWLGPYSTDTTEPFQFLEIGFYNGMGYESYKEFMPAAELHSMEINCKEDGDYGINYAKQSPHYQQYLDDKRLHCGDASNLDFLNRIWSREMNRPNAPPLKVVVDDGSHLSRHMAQSVMFWFPRIQPRGLMIVEDIQPINLADKFRTQFLPQIMADLHFCGDPKWLDQPCFPTLQPLLASIHCEMNICVFERNDQPAVNLPVAQSGLPANALDLKKCKSFMRD